MSLVVVVQSPALAQPYFTEVLWVCVARFWQWGCYRGGFCEKFPLCLIKPVPAGSKTDPPLAKAISDGGSASGIMCLRRGEKKKLGGETAVEREE